MIKRINMFSVLWLFITMATCAQNQNKQMEKTNINPLLCDTETGMCEIPTAKPAPEEHVISAKQKPVTIIYFTDPICSSCWGIEPQLRKLKLEYGTDLEIEYRMGGLLPDWSYNSGGISKPSDVAHHWDEVSVNYDMPIDGDVWLEDPLSSSYPPSIAFKAAQMQDQQKAIVFLRKIREMVFLEKKNITKWEHLNDAALKAGLDTVKLKSDFNSSAKLLFSDDLELSRKLGVRGFPTLFFVNREEQNFKVYGTRPYAELEAALLKAHPKSTKKVYDHSWKYLFEKYPTLTTREFAELSEQSKTSAQEQLEKLVSEHRIIRKPSKNGPIWELKRP